MFCTKCGKSIPEGAKFCCYCGADVDLTRMVSRKSTLAGEKAFYCVGCGANLSVEHRDEIIVCEYCGARNKNPYEIKKTPGKVTLSFLTLNNRYKNVSITIKETSQSYLLENNHLVQLELEPGEYSLIFVFGEKKLFKRMLKIYSGETSVDVSAYCSRVACNIGFSYKNSIALSMDDIDNFEGYEYSKFVKRLSAMGFKNVEAIPKTVGSKKKGLVNDMMVDEVSIEALCDSITNSSGRGEFDEVSCSYKIPYEAKISVFYNA